VVEEFTGYKVDRYKACQLSALSTRPQSASCLPYKFASQSLLRKISADKPCIPYGISATGILQPKVIHLSSCNEQRTYN
jgi:hypothetical protein